MMGVNLLQHDFGPHGAFLQELWQKTAGGFAPYQSRIEALARVAPSRIVLDGERVSVGARSDLTPVQRDQLLDLLRALKPWRKGPFSLFGVDIDSEWDSSLKWRRVAPHITPLAGRRVLDVGSSNGYYLYRMSAGDPAVILGLEPYTRYFAQFYLLQHFIKAPRLHCLPAKLEDLTDMSGWFDTVFYMGILYHRRCPLESLSFLNALLAPAGELILETLIIDGDGDLALCPRHRYAAMRNVFFIPTLPCLTGWLERSGFANIRCVNISKTTYAEQRKTPWIDSDSLDAFLDARNPEQTVEGYPAPLRAVVLATPKTAASKG